MSEAPGVIPGRGTDGLVINIYEEVLQRTWSDGGVQRPAPNERMQSARREQPSLPHNTPNNYRRLNNLTTNGTETPNSRPRAKFGPHLGT